LGNNFTLLLQRFDMNKISEGNSGNFREVVNVKRV